MHKKLIEKLRSYQTFKSYEEVNAAVEAFLAENMVTETQLRVLRVIQHHAKVVPGVAILKYATIAEYVGVHKRTVERAVSKLVKAGIISKHNQTRELNGGDGANIYVINQYADALADADDDADADADTDASQGVPDSAESEVAASSEGAEYVEHVDYVEYEENMNSKEKNKYVLNVQDADNSINQEPNSSNQGNNQKSKQKGVQLREGIKLDKKFVPHSVPKEFADYVGRYINDAVDIYNLYGRAILAANKIGAPMVRDDIALEAFEQTLFAHKAGKIRGDFYGYFYGTYYQMHEQEHAAAIRRETMKKRGFNWVANAAADNGMDTAAVIEWL